MGWLGASFAFALLLSLSSCTDSDTAGSSRGLRHLALRDPQPETRAAITETVSAQIAVPVKAELATWKIEPADKFTVSFHKDWGLQRAPDAHDPDSTETQAFVPERMLFLGPGPRQIEIPGPFDPGSFNRVRLLLKTSARLELAVQLKSRGQLVSRQTAQVLDKQTYPQLVTFEFPLNAKNESLMRGGIEALVIQVETAGKPWSLAGLELLKPPAHQWMPQPGAAELWPFGDRLHRVVGLSPELPLETSFEVDSSEYLRLTWGVPNAVPPAQDAELTKTTRRSQSALSPELDFELRDASSLEVLRQDSFSLAGPQKQWHSLDWNLKKWVGTQVQLRVSVRDGLALVGEVRVAPSKAPAQPDSTNQALGPRANFTEAPTVLLVTSDTHRADHISISGLGVELRTPTLDTLAKSGVLFEESYASTNITIPSHAALMTGVHPRDTRVWTNRTLLADSAQTLAEAFHENNWLTWAVVGGSHLLPKNCGLGQGFDRYSGPERSLRLAEDNMQELFDWLPEAKGQPLMVWLHLNDAHKPYDAPEPYKYWYYPKDKDPYERVGERPAGYPPPSNLKLWDASWAVAQYRGDVSYLDAQLGRLFKTRLGRGVVAFTSDHGESLGDVPVGWGHGAVYPSMLRVPLVMAWPGSPENKRVTGRSEHLYLGDALLQLAGLQQRLDGGGSNASSSLLETIERGEAREAPRFSISNDGYDASVTLGPWHLLMGLVDNRNRVSPKRLHSVRHRVELYHIGEDPDCNRELTGSLKTELLAKLDVLPVSAAELSTDESSQTTAKQQASRLRQLLVTWLREAQPRNWSGAAQLDVTDLQELAQLGYLVDQAPSPSDASLELFPESCDCTHCQPYTALGDDR